MITTTDPPGPPAPDLGLACYGCGGGILAVKDSRPAPNAVRRRRKCLNCGMRFTSFEIMSRTGDDTHRLFEALHLYDRLDGMPKPWRNVILAMIEGLALQPFAGGPQRLVVHQPAAAAEPPDKEEPRG